MDARQYTLKLQQDSFLRERVFGFRELSDAKIQKRMEHLHICLAGPYYCIILFAPYLMERDPLEIDSTLTKLLNNVREYYTRAGMSCYTISDTYCNVVCVLSISSEEELKKLNKLTLRITNDLIKYHGFDMYVGIGEKVEKLSQLNRSKDSAAEALAHKFTFSEMHVISAKDVRRYYNQSDVELKIHYDWIIGCFHDGNMDLLEVRLRNLFSVVMSESQDELDSIRNVCIELTAMLLRVVREMGVASTPEMDGIYTYIAQLGSITEIGEWFLNYCSGLMQKVGDLRKDKTQQILEMADRFIDDNLGDQNLTIQTISDYVGLSAPYFSNIFYRTRGMHLSEYINRVRVKRAQKCLLESTDKVAVIAQSLGFSSPSYFNTVFKRFTGTTPKHYREPSETIKSMDE